MTICVAVKVHDCLVLAADSATSFVGPGPNGDSAILNVYAHGNKVFNLIKGQPIGAMTCGMGNIGRSSISSLAKVLRQQLSAGEGVDLAGYTVEDIAKRTKQFFFDETYCALSEKPQGDHSLDFFVGGYSSQSHHPELWQIMLRNGTCAEPVKLEAGDDNAYVAWAGQPEALNRLIFGYSQRLPEALVAAGVEASQIAPLVAHIQSFTEVRLAEEPMPIGDAIGLADFLVDTTKRYVHFLRGADTVGGDTDLATITRHEGFRWIKRKHFYPRELNRETDHA